MVAAASREDLKLIQESEAQLWAIEIKHKQEFCLYYDVLNGEGIQKNLNGRQAVLIPRTFTHKSTALSLHYQAI